MRARGRRRGPRVQRGDAPGMQRTMKINENEKHAGFASLLPYHGFRGIFSGAKVHDRLFSLLILCDASSTYRFLLRFLLFPLVLPHGSRTFSRKLPSAQCGIQTFPVYPPLGDDKGIYVFYWFYNVFQ